MDKTIAKPPFSEKGGGGVEYKLIAKPRFLWETLPDHNKPETRSPGVGITNLWLVMCKARLKNLKAVSLRLSSTNKPK